jgi:hypothetical protein
MIKEISHVSLPPRDVNPAVPSQPRRESVASRMKIETSLPIVLPMYQPTVSADHLALTTKDEVITSRMKTKVTTAAKDSTCLFAKDWILFMFVVSL